MPSVKVSEKTHEWLKDFKDKEKFKTFDGAIRHLLPSTMQEPEWEDYETIFQSSRVISEKMIEEYKKEPRKDDPKNDLTFIMNLANEGLKFTYRDSDFRGESDINMAIGMTALAVRNIVFYLHNLLENDNENPP